MSGTWRRKDLALALADLGLAQGDALVVHSSLRKVGPIEEGAAGLIDTLLDVVGAQGVVMAPTFTYGTAYFDPLSTPGRTGALSEVLRSRPDAVRSVHPFFSVAAIGAPARALCQGHHLVPGLAEQSPLGRLARMGGSVLLIGVGHTRNSTIHVGEFRAEAPYLDIPFNPAWPSRAQVLIDGELRSYSYSLFPGCSRSFDIIETELRHRGAISEGRIGEATAQRVPAQAVIGLAASMVVEDPSSLLCKDSDCYRCTRARARLGAGRSSRRAD